MFPSTKKKKKRGKERNLCLVSKFKRNVFDDIRQDVKKLLYLKT